MDRRGLLFSVLLVVVLIRPGSSVIAQQQPTPDQQPAFRSGVELVTVEVGVLDKDGTPVRGLQPGDFVVTVSGQPRRVVTADYIDATDATSTMAEKPGAPSDRVPISTNEGSGVGRLVVFVVDSNTIEPGDARRITVDASRFLSGLSFSDRSAVVPIPIGRNIPFTWAHERVREALLRTAVSGGGSNSTWEYGSLSEARDIATRGAFTLREVAMRECSTSLASRGSGLGGGATSSSSPSSGQSSPQGGSSPGGSGSPGGAPGGAPSSGGGGGSIGASLANDRCEREIQSQAEMAWNMARATSLASITALRRVLATLGRVQGDKTLVLISGGWPLDEHDETSLLRMVADEAATARVKIFTIFVPVNPVSASRRMMTLTSRNDQNLFWWPVENLAGMTGGRAFRADTGAAGIFDRLGRELSGYYRIGVEKDLTDAGASGRPMKIKVSKDGVMVRARNLFDVATYEDRDWAARLSTALDSPAPATAIGLRLTSYLAADPEEPSAIRLLLAGEAARLRPGEATLQVVVRDLEGQRVVGGEQRLGEVAAGTLPFSTNIRVPPGSYVVRVAIQDGTGRVGSVDHRVEARAIPIGPLSGTGPMLVQVSGTGRGDARLALDGLQRDERLALEIDLQGDGAQLAGADVTFEIAAKADGPALISKPANLNGGHGGLVAQALADVRVLPPGEYIARAKVQSENRTLGELRRAFTLLGLTPAASIVAAGGSSVGSTAMSGMASPAAAIRGRAVGALPPFAVSHVLAPGVLSGFLDRVEARPDAAFPGVPDLLSRARTSGVSALAITDAQAAQTPVAAFLRGLNLLAQNKLNPAAAAFREAMRASPNFYPAMVYLGACYAAAGNDKEASAVWRTALIKEGGSPAVHVLLADSLLRQGNGAIALKVVDAARERWPDDADLKRRFVVASLLAGNPGPGLRTLDELATSGASDEPTLAFGLLVLYESLTQGRAIESADADRARMMRLADAYRTRGGPSLALVETWVEAVRKAR